MLLPVNLAFLECLFMPGCCSSFSHELSINKDDVIMIWKHISRADFRLRSNIYLWKMIGITCTWCSVARVKRHQDDLDISFLWQKIIFLSNGNRESHKDFFFGGSLRALTWTFRASQWTSPWMDLTSPWKLFSSRLSTLFLFSVKDKIVAHTIEMSSDNVYLHLSPQTHTRAPNKSYGLLGYWRVKLCCLSIKLIVSRYLLISFYLRPNILQPLDTTLNLITERWWCKTVN